MENTQHLLPLPRITKYMTISYLTCTLPKSYTRNRIDFGFFFPWGTFPTFKYSTASLSHQRQMCSCSAAKQFNSGYLLLKEQISFLPSHHLPSKHLTSQRTRKPLKQQKMAWTGSVWITGKQRLAQTRRHQEQ